MSGCKTCTSADNNQVAVAGCKNNGGCSTGGCNKMNVFDWLSNMDMPTDDDFDMVEVRFKGGRKEFFQNAHNLRLNTGDAIVVDVPNGHHLGHVSLQGELVRLQMKKKNVDIDGEIRAIYRIASQRDLQKYEEVKNKETNLLYRTREIIRDFKLTMKLSDVEIQADSSKATFYYSAEDRVDFRELIKALATEFKLRIEMRQINLRQEAGRLGGLGVCGRELCCSTWLSDFKNVSTSAARYQNLSLNPGKLSGQCGRLKCCLNYELDSYMDALKYIPEVEKPIKTEQGNAYLQKTDIFRKTMWFSFKDDNNWHPVGTDRVKEILEMNESDKMPHSLLQNKSDHEVEEVGSLNSDLEMLDKKIRKRWNKGGNSNNKKRKKRNKPHPNNKRQN